MNRFRKRSDAKRGQVPVSLREAPQQDSLPPLPPASDFRTSLILPDLTRRFSVLRNSSGEPIGLDELKSKFAEQRARGSENRVSESEEDMILETLSRLRRGNTRQRSNADSDAAPSSGMSMISNFSEDHDRASRISASPSLVGGQSVRSTTTTSSALHGSPSVASLSSAKSRRMSNNLFGSGKFQDHSYMRNAHQRRPPTLSNAGRSVKQSDSATSMNTLSSRPGNNSVYSDTQSLRPTTPESSGYTTSTPSSPNKMLPMKEEALDQVSHSKAFEGVSPRLSPEILGRASLALDEVIRELEEEGDDEIVMERSPIAHVVNGDYATVAKPVSEPSPSSTSLPAFPVEYEPGMALSSDEQLITDEAQRTSPYPSSRTTSPTPRLPGYIPGMPRPMTPRDSSFDSDDQTPSATPRATSPRLPGVSTHAPPLVTQALVSSMHRTNSNASTSRGSRPTSPTVVSPVSPSPLFFHRTTSGRYTPEDRPRNDSSSPSPDTVDSPVLGRRRPISPLSGPAFQPMATISSSRPGTPSNIVWNMPLNANTNGKGHGRSGSMSGQSMSGHSRNGSTASIPDVNGDLDHSNTRSLLSPALPDSPWIDNGHASTTSLPMNPEYRPPSAMSGIDLGSPIQIANRPFRSPTPTSGNAHSPTSPTFTEHSTYMNGNGFSSSTRSSRQNGHSSFSLGPAHALLLSPIGNASRSSLESAGSSYHSWDEDHRKDRLFDLFSHLDSQHAEWHDLPIDKSSSSTSKTTPYESQNSEEIVRRQVGLTKSDMLMIQDKLIQSALTKASTPEGRHRAGSVRKRRPSTQSNYSYNGDRAATPAQQPSIAPIAPPSRHSNTDHIAKASALLDSVVDSIQSPQKQTIGLAGTEDNMLSAQPSQIPVLPSPTQRHRALADALFGAEDRDRSSTPSQTLFEMAVADKTTSELSPSVFPHSPHSQSHGHEAPELSAGPRPTIVSPSTSISASSTPTTFPGQGHATQLALDVQRRAEAATAALRKSPSIPKMADTTGSTRKRISPNQISSPTLLSASTSVDTIPLPASQPLVNGGPSRLGSRFKKLRGTLKTKAPPHLGEETALHRFDAKTPPSAQTATFNPALFASTPVISSATYPSAPRLSPPVIPAVPSSAGPGLKSFISRFRKRPLEVVSPLDRRVGSSGSNIPTPTVSSLAPYERVGVPNVNMQSQSAPASKSQFTPSLPPTPQLPFSQVFSAAQPIPEGTAVPTNSTSPAASMDEAALKQLFDAASNLGLDQAALNDLIARSPSTSSHSTAWTRLTRSHSAAGSRRSQRPDFRDSGIPQSPVPTESRPSIDAVSARPSVEVKQLTIRKNSESTSAIRPQQAGTDPLKAIVRRTIIVPSDSRTTAMDLNALLRKQSTSRRRRSAGAGSVQSNRSIQDRAPTPPPPRSTGGRRFSTDRSPPVPQLPHSFTAQFDGSSPPNQVETSNSTYDSLYEMYAGDANGRISTNVNSGNHLSATPQLAGEEGVPDSGPAVEVIELANGETIWSIVNGLRDDDSESFYDNRASFASEYSADGVKVFFKEHGRKTSKSSNTSFLSRKKQAQSSASNRPETKVFFSSSAQIGRLIENMSRDMDAGSFNITPERVHGHAAHSASSSVGSAADMRWTLEERLEHMLGSMSHSS